MSVLDIVLKKLVANCERVIIGYPSKALDNGKATGLHYSIEYYERQSVNASASDMHRLTAKVAGKVLASNELHEFIGTLIEKYATEEAVLGYETSGLKEEDADQAKNDTKVVSVPKTRKVAVKKAPAKSTAKTTRKTPAKTAASK